MKIESNKLVTFRLGDDHFAADIFSVERVLRYTTPTSVPDMPEYIEGVIDYQGRVVPIVNRHHFAVFRARTLCDHDHRVTRYLRQTTTKS